MCVTSVDHYSPCNRSMRHLKGRENVSSQRGVIKFVCIPRSELGFMNSFHMQETKY